MARTSSNHKARRQGRSGALRNGLVAVVALAAVGTLIVTLDRARETAEERLTVIGVEAREHGADALAADASAQLSHASGLGSEVLLTPVGGEHHGGAFHVSFACGADATDLRCRADREKAGAQADTALADLLERPEPEHVDVLAALRRTAEHVAAQPVDGDVDVYLNITGRHDDDAIELVGADLGERHDELLDAARDHERLPESCDGWRVHVVVPTTGDPSQDRARDDALAALIDHCGGALETVTQRWLADGAVAGPEPTHAGDDAGATDDQAREPVERDRFTLAETLFDVKSAALRPGARAALDEIAGRVAHHLDAGLDVAVAIDGYADDTGPEELNERLSQQRADTVAAALAERVDLPEGAVEANGHGSLPDDGSEEARQANRRVDVTVSAR